MSSLRSNKNTLYRLFLTELKNAYSAEKQILEELPNLIKLASLRELKKAFSKHLKETKMQENRLKRIFFLLGYEPREEMCDGMKGILAEGKKLLAKKSKSALLDAALIGSAQKVEHYEIASYNTLKNFAKHLDLESEIKALLQKTLDEEEAADKKLNRIAEGTLFASGINEEAAEAAA
jgi:ferritin-like metal-binding protein YciE